MAEPWKTVLIWSTVAVGVVGGVYWLGPVGGIVGFVPGTVLAFRWKR